MEDGDGERIRKLWNHTRPSRNLTRKSLFVYKRVSLQKSYIPQSSLFVFNTCLCENNKLTPDRVFSILCTLKIRWLRKT